MHREKSPEVSLWNLSPIQRWLKSTDNFVIIFYLKTRASYSQSINRYLAKKSLYISPGVHEGNSLCSYRKRIQEIAWMVFSSPMLVFLNSSTASPKGWEVLWLFWGLCDLFQQSKRGKVPSPPSPCPGTATLPSKGQDTFGEGDLKTISIPGSLLISWQGKGEDGGCQP